MKWKNILKSGRRYSIWTNPFDNLKIIAGITRPGGISTILNPCSCFCRDYFLSVVNKFIKLCDSDIGYISPFHVLCINHGNGSHIEDFPNRAVDLQNMDWFIQT